MKRSQRLTALVCSVLALAAGLTLLVTNQIAAQTNRPEQWKKVQKAIDKGLPKTAVQEIEPIIESAMKDKAYPEAIKAIAKKIALEGTIQGNKPEERVTRMEAEIAKAPAEMKPVMQAILANWYWHYFQQNRWRFLNRSATAAPPGADFTTWDLPRLFAEIDARFTKALASAPVLQRTPVTVFDDLLNKGNTPDAWRPTLYDFVAQEALKFYSSGEQAAAKPEDAFEVSADSPIFGGADDFLAWQPPTTDTAAPKLKAIRLHQDLLRFHRRDADPAAFLLAALACTFLFFYEYMPPVRSVHIPYDLDGYHFSLAAYGFQALHQGRLPQWDPSIYGGMSFAANVQAAFYYPGTWLMYLATWGRDRKSTRLNSSHRT